MARYLLIVVSAFALAAIVTPSMRRLAMRLGIVDQPAARKLHTRPMPLMGGVAIYLAFIAALLIWGDRFYVQQVIGIVLGASLCSFLGLWDDRRSIGAGLKLLGQLVAAAILIISGVQVHVLPYPAVNVALTLLWVVGITNAMNLLDNMDGLCGGVGAIAAAFFLLMAAMSGQYLVGALAAALLGACIGFLVYNVNPASIFMGDAGSLFLGFTLAAVGIKLRFPDNVVFVTWMAPVLVLGLPIFDTTLVFVSRLRRQLNPLTHPGKDHVSHRLERRGMTAPRSGADALPGVLCAGGAGDVRDAGVHARELPRRGSGVLAGALAALAAGVGHWRRGASRGRSHTRGSRGRTRRGVRLYVTPVRSDLCEGNNGQET